MDWYKITLRLASPTPTPWHADTIFGHVCWALAFTEGESFMDNFLGLYNIGAPPLVLSNGFPGDLLPRPLLAGAREAAATGEAARQAFRQAKDVRGSAWLSPEEFDLARRGLPFSPLPRRPFETHPTMHNQINRLTGTTGSEGTLYATEETTLAKDVGGRITIFALVDSGFVDGLRRCLAHLAATGYGKRKSAGYGAIAGVAMEPFPGFPPIEGENGFVSLSNFVPAAADPTHGTWNTLVKRGKLGEDFAVAGDAFKRPVIMLVAGSCFYDSPVRQFYGRLVSDVHPDFPAVVQYGLALPVGIRLTGQPGAPA